MKVNSFVGVTVSFVNLCAIISGLYVGGFNGILEMDGFKDTFAELYEVSRNSSSLQQNETRGCGSGSGTTSDSLIGIIVASANFGSFLGSVIAGWLSDHFSRKYGLAISGVVMLLGTGLLSASFFVWMLIVARILNGIAIGIFYMVMPVYIAEMSPKESRGILGSTMGFAYNLGVAIGFLASIGFTRFAIGWRISTVITAAIAVIFAVGMSFMPHTPRWLMMKGRDQEALQVLSRINRHRKSETMVDTFIELEELRTAIKPSSMNSMRLILKELYRYKYRLLLGSALFVFAATSGTFIYYFSTSIFCDAGIPAFYATLIVGPILLTASIVLTFFIDKLGRKPLFLLCTLLVIVVGLIIAVLIHLFDTSEAAVGYTIVVLICIYAFGVSCSWVTLPFVIISEIFPVPIRGATVAIATAIYFTSIAVVNQVTPIIIGSPLQLHGYFYIVTGCNILALFVVLFGLPETKGVSLEEMDKVFSQNIWERFIGTFKYSFAKSNMVEKDLSAADYKCSSKTDLGPASDRKLKWAQNT